MWVRQWPRVGDDGPPSTGVWGGRWNDCVEEMDGVAFPSGGGHGTPGPGQTSPGWSPPPLPMYTFGDKFIDLSEKIIKLVPLMKNLSTVNIFMYEFA